MTQEEAIEVYDGLINTKIKEAFEFFAPELAESKDERIRKEINTLHSEIDTCITELLKARTDKNAEAESKALFKMERLMVATLQDLSCIEDYLSLRPHWKPSAQQIDALERAIVKTHTVNDIGILAELRDNLKKL